MRESPKTFQALRFPSLDSSDFILLSSRILQSVLSDTEMQKIQRAYLTNDYITAFDVIAAACASHSAQLDPKVIALIKQQAKICSAHDDPQKNESRRYFDTTLAMKVWDAQGPEEFQSVAKMTPILDIIDMQIPKPPLRPHIITSKQDVAATIGPIHQYGAQSVPLKEQSQALRRVPTSKYKYKDRGPRFEDREAQSSNPGIMKANHAMPFNERLHNGDDTLTVAKGKVTDMFPIDLTKQDGFSINRPTIPFVNSISGTTSDFITLMKGYMKTHKDDPNLQKDVNNLMKLFMAFTCKSGYHAITEMLEVLKEPEVEKIFQERGVILNPIPSAILAKAFDQAAQHAETINLQRGMRQELLERTTPPAEHTPPANLPPTSTPLPQASSHVDKLKNQQRAEEKGRVPSGRGS